MRSFAYRGFLQGSLAHSHDESSPWSVETFAAEATGLLKGVRVRVRVRVGVGVGVGVSERAETKTQIDGHSEVCNRSGPWGVVCARSM